MCVSSQSWPLALLPPLCCPGVNTMLRKVAVAAASNPHVEIRQDGEKFYIKTSTSVRTTEINFHIGEEFDEETVDGRKCKVNGSMGGEPHSRHHSGTDNMQTYLLFISISIIVLLLNCGRLPPCCRGWRAEHPPSWAGWCHGHVCADFLSLQWLWSC